MRARVALLLIAALAVAACRAPEPLTLPSSPLVPLSPSAGAVTATDDASGTVRVAYSDAPLTWHGALGDDPAATDLRALWGLPLYRLGPDGIPRPALVARSETSDGPEGFAVTLALREGEWTDGAPVTAADVVATLEALRAEGRTQALAPIAEVSALDARTVELRFSGPYAPWRDLLAELPGVLPAALLDEQGLAAYDDDVPVSGGWFRLAELDPGRSARFTAHPSGPLGPPRLAAVEVLITPRYDTALGLVDDGRADVVLGHLALNPVERAEAVGRAVTAAAPLGGTLVALEWRPGGALGGRDDADARRAVGRGADLSEFVEGLLGAYGALATSPWPEVDGPFTADGWPGAIGRALPTLRLLAPEDHEATAFSTRALRRALSGTSVALELTTAGTPTFVAEAGRTPDVALRIRRSTRRPPLAELVGEATPAVLAADAAPLSEVATIDAGLRAAAEQAYVWPLYRPGVAHVWSERVSGIRPSAWPGSGLWNVGEWSVEP